MTTPAEAIDAIIANPDDDALRLSFAELVRTYDEPRARFVELQVARAAKQRRERRSAQELPGREEGLLERHGRKWTHTIDKFTSSVEFYRGFVSRIVIEPYLFLEYGEWLMINEPIQHVDFLPAQDDDRFPLDELVASPLLERLDSMDLAGLGLTDADMAKLAASPHLSRLVWLDLSGNPLGPAGFEALAASPTTRKVLYIERRESFGHRYFPGQRFEQTDRMRSIHWEDFEWEWTDISAEGKAWQKKYGYVPWLHITDNSCDRFDARWYVDNGVLPVKPAGSAVG